MAERCPVVAHVLASPPTGRPNSPRRLLPLRKDFLTRNQSRWRIAVGERTDPIPLGGDVAFPRLPQAEAARILDAARILHIESGIFNQDGRSIPHGTARKPPDCPSTAHGRLLIQAEDPSPKEAGTGPPLWDRHEERDKLRIFLLFLRYYCSRLIGTTRFQYDSISHFISRNLRSLRFFCQLCHFYGQDGHFCIKFCSKFEERFRACEAGVTLRRVTSQLPSIGEK